MAVKKRKTCGEETESGLGAKNPAYGFKWIHIGKTCTHFLFSFLFEIFFIFFFPSVIRSCSCALFCSVYHITSDIYDLKVLATTRIHTLLFDCMTILFGKNVQF